MTFIRRAAVTAAVAALSLTAAPAFAATYADADAKGDGTVERCTGPGGQNCTVEVDPAVANGDIVRTAVDHRARTVVIRTRYRALNPTADTRLELVSLRTNEGVKRDVTVVLARRAARSRVLMTRPNGQIVQCRGLSQVTDYAAETIKVVVPRACVSQPRWVRVGAAYVAFGGSETERTTFVDDGLLDGRLDENALTLSPRIRRG